MAIKSIEEVIQGDPAIRKLLKQVFILNKQLNVRKERGEDPRTAAFAKEINDIENITDQTAHFISIRYGGNASQIAELISYRVAEWANLLSPEDDVYPDL